MSVGHEVKNVTAPLGLLALGGLVLWLLASWTGRVAPKDAEAIQGAKLTLALSRPFHAQIARLQASQARHGASGMRLMAVVVQDTARTGRLLADVDSLRHENAALDTLLTGLVAQRDTALQAVAEFRLVVFAAQAEAKLAKDRVAALETQLRNVLQVAECRVLGIGFLPRCPSRTASLVLGAGIGVAAVVLVR